MNTNLTEVKKRANEHMNEELRIMEMVLQLDVEDCRDFTKWFTDLPQCKCIDEVKEILRRKAEMKKIA